MTLKKPKYLFKAWPSELNLVHAMDPPAGRCHVGDAEVLRS